MASRMGYHAVESLIEGRHNVFVGILNNRMQLYSIGECRQRRKERLAKSG